MKLLYVVHQYFPDCFSGTEQYCLATSREARRRGDDVTVLALDPDHGRDDPPLCVYDRPYDGFSVLRLRHWRGLQPNDVLREYENPLVAARFREVLAELRPQAVHFFHLRNLGADLIAAARDSGARTVVSLTDFWFLCPRFTLLRSDGALCDGPPEGGAGCVPCAHPELEAELASSWRASAQALAEGLRAPSTGTGPAARLAALLRRKPVLLARLEAADAVFAPSRFLAAMFERNGFPAARLQVEPYGLEPGAVRQAVVRRPRDPLRVGYAGVLSPWKAPHVLIDAVRRIESPLRLLVHGRTEEPMFADYIASLRVRAGDDPRIAFPGPFDRASVSDVLAELDLLVVPSIWYENTPFVMLEAMEAGVPVVASDLGGMSELIVDGENGFLFASGDAAALARVLQRCIDEPALVARLRPKPPASIADNYDAFARVYRETPRGRDR